MRSVEDILRVAGRLVRTGRLRARFAGSANYWEQRYARGGNSGAGSYGRLAVFKAETLNAFLGRHQIASVIEFGCGDGSQLEMLECSDYLGVDVSATAVETCRRRFQDDDRKRFCALSEHDGSMAEMTLSLDVVYHLVEDEVFERYMETLFDAASRFVVVYASNHDGPGPSVHVRHRRFTDWVGENRPQWRLCDMVKNRYPALQGAPDESFADFYFFERLPGAEGADETGAPR